MTFSSHSNRYLNTSNNSSIYIMVPTLKYLKKGGRITAAAAAIGSLLSIKPVLQIQGEKLDAYAKVLTIKQAKSKMINAIKKDIETRFNQLNSDQKLVVSVAHTSTTMDDVNEFEQEIKSEFANYPILFKDPLPLAIACHIGTGALAVTVTVVHKGINID